MGRAHVELGRSETFKHNTLWRSSIDPTAGLVESGSVAVSGPAHTLRALAAALVEAADELDRHAEGVRMGGRA